MTDPDVRPRTGWIDHPDGTRTPVRYVPYPDRPGSYQPVELDHGARVALANGDRLHADQLGAGQSINVHIRPPHTPQPEISEDHPENS